MQPYILDLTNDEELTDVWMREIDGELFIWSKERTNKTRREKRMEQQRRGKLQNESTEEKITSPEDERRTMRHNIRRAAGSPEH